MGLIPQFVQNFETIFRGIQKRAFWTITRQFIGNSGVHSGSTAHKESALLILERVESVILDQIS